MNVYILLDLDYGVCLHNHQYTSKINNTKETALLNLDLIDVKASESFVKSGDVPHR